MSEIARIRDQLHRAFEGDAWHGPSLVEILGDVDATTAAAHPIADAHSIWELVLHIAAWEDVTRRRLAGEKADPTDAENFPPVTATHAAAWERAKAALIAGHRALEASLEALTDADLTRRIPGREYDAYFLLHGVIQHDLYHAGQIAVLKKG